MRIPSGLAFRGFVALLAGLMLASCNAIDTSGTGALAPIDEVTLTGTWDLRHLVQKGMIISTTGGKADTTKVDRDTSFTGSAYTTQYKGDLTFVTTVPGPPPAKASKVIGKWSLSGGRLTTLTGAAAPYDTAVSDVGLNQGQLVTHSHQIKTTASPTYPAATVLNDITIDAASSKE